MLIKEEIKKRGVKTAFKDLPVAAQKSIIFYMALDGDVWSEIIKDNPLRTEKDWIKAINATIQVYADLTYFYYEMPTKKFKKLIMQTQGDFAKEFNSFKEYHKWYIEGGDIPDYSSDNRWCALVWDEIEGVIDGWHRIHSYIKSGHKTIPLIL